ncbi:hypothetical protein H5410_039823 [Solanum commersonii]|uniref:ATP-dependent DNA helicase n=1 Tax=Solanum commersonii TaxID=4109 RepID=A0A9J5XN92_SOLCO|nr:hypothetical protein H5410_039823 [Solanum commersonii]
MAERLTINVITSETKEWTVKVQVVDKGRPRDNLQKTNKYQLIMILQDEELFRSRFVFVRLYRLLPTGTDVLGKLLDVLRRGERDASQVGRNRIIPPSFTDGPRDMRYRYMDAMTLVQRFSAFNYDFLYSMGRDINEFELIPEIIKASAMAKEAKYVLSERNIIVSEKDLLLQRQLNRDQQIAYNTILNRVFSNKPGAFFIDGPGGTGKTFLYRVLLSIVRHQGFVALATTSFGVAASLLPGGRTTHSRFKLPIEIDGIFSCNISKQSSLASLIQDAKLIVWDEISMAIEEMIEALDLLLKDLMETNILIVGKVVVFSGDFRQTLPIVHGDHLMAERLTINVITSETKEWTVKVQVVDKGRPRDNLQKTNKYQLIMILQDEEETQVQGIMYGSDIKSYAELFIPYHTYLISVASVIESNHAYGIPINTFLWTIDKCTLIEPIEKVDPPEASLPPLTRLTLTMFNNFHHQPEGLEFDVLAIVVNVALPICTTNGSRIQELIIMDNQ